jgi:hypothetical protein
MAGGTRIAATSTEHSLGGPQIAPTVFTSFVSRSLCTVDVRDWEVQRPSPGDLSSVFSPGFKARGARLQNCPSPATQKNPRFFTGGPNRYNFVGVSSLAVVRERWGCRYLHQHYLVPSARLLCPQQRYYLDSTASTAASRCTRTCSMYSLSI